ncbi:MAG: SprB repeat-containing protein, partial [Bacteroidia bacterium]
MKANLFFWLLSSLLFGRVTFAQQLIINEVSQGPSGAKEYVELIVVGTPTCNAIPCMDLRNYIIDDNNGNHASGAGTGIASGCVRLQNISFWSCIPIGTMILIYNDADQNVLVPPQDLSMLDGNCKLIIPISNCTLLERHTSVPSTGTSIYPNSGFTNCGSWTPISMANTDDSFQTIDPSGSLVHSVSWGNNNIATIIYFAGSAAGKVAVMNNTIDNNPANQANWTMINVAGNETPGSPNNAVNSNWINSMNNSCTALLPFTAITSFSNTGCICNGSATISPSGAIGPYTYTWLPSGGNSNNASGLCSGVYTVNSTSFNGCMQTKTVNISSVSTLTLAISNNSIACNGLSNGSATVTASGGSPGYSYTWSPSGGNASTANGLAPGTYTVFVKDAGNCNGTITTTISQPTAALSSAVSSSSIFCFGAATGAATINANGGTPGYSYTWTPSGGNATTANNLSVGIYTVTIKDINNCITLNTVSITQPLTGLTSAISSTNILCFSSATGAASVNVNGGSPAFSYAWSPSGGNAITSLGLTSGNYTVTVSDSHSCITTSTVFISQPLSALTGVISATNILCFGNNNGVASIVANGGTPGYSYTWSPSGGNSATANGLSSGTYSVIIKDVNNCSLTATTVITQPASSLTAAISSTNILCFGANTGAASVIVNGGTPAYSYTWSPLGGNASSSSGLPAGNYSVQINDINNCTITKTVTIIQPATGLAA